MMTIITITVKKLFMYIAIVVETEKKKNPTMLANKIVSFV